MATIKFFLQSKNNPAGIYVRFKEGRNIDAKAKTKYAINNEEWSKIKGQPKNLKDEFHKKLNEELNKLRNDLLIHYNKSIGITSIDSKWLKDFLNPSKHSEDIPSSLLEYIDYYLKHKRSVFKQATIKKVNVNKQLIDRFQKDAKKQYLINEVNAEFKLKFENYCISQNYSSNTIARAIKSIKTICYHAQDNGIPVHFQLKNISVKFTKVEKIFLTINEQNAIQNVDLDKDYLDNARDWLIISCETGQRVSDFLRFKKENIIYINSSKVEKNKSIPIIEFNQFKTEKPCAVPLSSRVIAILEKRNGEFPRKISAPKFNQFIKEVCKKAGLTELTKGSKKNAKTNRKESGIFPKFELVTSHIGRITFVTKYFGETPSGVIMKTTGHSTEKVFLDYMNKTEIDSALQMAEYIN